MPCKEPVRTLENTPMLYRPCSASFDTGSGETGRVEDRNLRKQKVSGNQLETPLAFAWPLHLPPKSSRTRPATHKLRQQTLINFRSLQSLLRPPPVGHIEASRCPTHLPYQ